MNADLRQDDFQVEMVGTVTPPPSLAEILAQISGAACFKQELTLTPGEVRILNDYLEAK